MHARDVIRMNIFNDEQVFFGIFKKDDCRYLRVYDVCVDIFWMKNDEGIFLELWGKIGALERVNRFVIFLNIFEF